MQWPEGPYTRYPRATMWLVRPGDYTPLGSEEPVDVDAFYVSKAPVTNSQYEVFAPGHRAAHGSAGDDEPVVNVSWEDANGYCQWYAEWTGKPFRLLTGMEWEYAARGEDEPGCWLEADPRGGEKCVWHQGNSGGVLHPIEQTLANSMGLYDILGGVWEWTSASAEEASYVQRGGSFRMTLEELGCGVQRSREMSWRGDDTGFRIARSL